MQNSLVVDLTEIDIGFGKPIELSSNILTAESGIYLLPAGHGWVGDFSFHTKLEDHPYLIVDLKSRRTVSRLRLFNRESIPDRAVPLAISMSDDKITWIQIGQINYVFGGRTKDNPLEFTFVQPLSTRFFKFEVQKETYFHLDYIEILSPLPSLPLGRLQNINSRGARLLAEYCHQISYGFSWTFTITLKAIADCRSHGITISRIDYALCLTPFKDEPDIDPYPLLFNAEPVSDEFDALVPLEIDHHGVYATSPLAELKKYAALYFSPSPTVWAFEAQILQQYRLSPDNALAIVYRGTDKDTEVPATPIEHYIRLALAIRQTQPGLQIIIQTDQEQARRTVLDTIPDAIFFAELPATQGTTAIHNLAVPEQFELSRSIFAIRMLGVIHLLSTMKYIITHTGNIGFWLGTYRGHGEGLFQFDVDRKLRGPSGEIMQQPEDIKII